MIDKSIDGGSNTNQVPIKKDVFSLKPLIFVAVFFLIHSYFIYADVTSPFLLLVGLTSLIVVAVFLVIGIRNILQKRYKSALILILMIPFLVLSLGIAPYVAYYIKLSLHEKQYLDEVKLIQPDEKGFRYKEFNWGHGSADLTTLVFDESDELELPEASRSKAWWEKVHGHNGILSCPYGVLKIKPHFFVVTLHCGGLL